MHLSPLKEALKLESEGRCEALYINKGDVAE